MGWNEKLFGLIGEDLPDERDLLATNFLPEKDIKELPNIFNLRPQMTAIQHQLYGSCFPKGTPILMEDFTEKSIESVRTWDKVYTHKHKKKKVNKIYKKWNEKKILEIKTEGVPSFITTQKHPIWCMQNTKDIKNKRNIKDGITDAQFISAMDIRENDYIGVPIIKDFIEPSLEILKNKDFLRFLGYYLAEGSMDKCKNGKYCRITLSLNIKEKDFVRDIKDISKSLFGITPSIKEIPKHNVVNVRIYDTTLAPFIKKLCGKLAWEKQLSSELMQLKPEFQKEIFDGWFRGDGHKRERRYMGITTSPIMARQLWWILIRNNIPANLKPHSFVGIGRRQAYDIDFTKNQRLKRKFIKDEYLWCRVSNIKKILIRENVYNLEVEDDNSYIANGIAVHNCTSHSVDGVAEYLNKKETGKEEKLANRFIYHNTKVISGLWNDEGDYLRNAVKSHNQYGVPLEIDFPDTPDTPWKTYVEKKPSQEVYDKALKYKSNGYLRVDPNLQAFRNALYQNKTPVAMGMNWHKSYKPDKTGRLPLPSGKSSGHAISYVGWDEHRDWLRNSWGTNWGNNGYFYIPTNEFTSHTFWPGWILYDLPNSWQDKIKSMHQRYIKGDEQYFKDGAIYWHIPDSPTLHLLLERKWVTEDVKDLPDNAIIEELPLSKLAYDYVKNGKIIFDDIFK